MNDSPLTAIGDEPVEARIVAWVLGEASGFEAAELERLCEERPELLVFRRRMHTLHGLLMEAASAQPDEGWKLPPEKRLLLDKVLDQPPPMRAEVLKEKRIRHSGRRTLYAIAACFMLSLVLLVLFIGRGIGSRVPRELQSKAFPADGKPVPLTTNFPKEAIEGTPRAIVLPETTPSSAPSAPAAKPAPPALASRETIPGNAQVHRDKRDAPQSVLAASDSLRRAELGNQEPMPSLASGEGGGGGRGSNKQSIQANEGQNAAEKNLAEEKPATTAAMPVLDRRFDEKAKDNGREDESQAMSGDKPREWIYPAEHEPPDVNQAKSGAGKPSRGLARVDAAKANFDRAGYDQTRAELLMDVDEARELSVSNEADGKSDTKSDSNKVKGNGALAKDPSNIVADSSTLSEKTKEIDKAIRAQEEKVEEHRRLQDTEEIPTTEDPYSTFSLNVSDASFKIAQAALAKGERPDPAGVKVEQFYNAVDYGDPAPTAGEPVAVNIEQSAHPVIPGRNLVRVALKTAAAGRSAAQPLRLTLLVDQSGSMVRDDRRAAMDKALDGLAKLLTPNDVVTVVGFSRKPNLLAEGLKGDEAAKLKELVNQAACEGGTNLEEAINLGEIMAERNKLAGAQNRIVLFTDGAANLGDASPAHLADKVKAMRQKGLALDIAGIAADELNDELLGALARNGNGRYYVVGKDGDASIATQLAGAFHPAAENVKVQVRFNSERVGRYKLIGFEKDRLKTEDFRNDTVAAAQLAAEEAGVAIYQVETLPGGNGELGEVSVRFRKADSGEMVERTWTIPHESSTPAFDRATPSMQLSVLSMLAAEKLRGGPLGQAIDFKQLTAPRAHVKAFYGNTGRAAEVLHMIDSL